MQKSKKNKSETKAVKKAKWQKWKICQLVAKKGKNKQKVQIDRKQQHMEKSC